MHEEAIRLGDNENLVGIITLPDNPIPAPAVLFLNAGLIHRIGPSRIYVRLARQLASLGLNCLRFDFSGIGDSCARRDDLPVDQALMDDVRQAMDYLEDRLGIAQFILIGHCGGAWAAFAVAGGDERVVGATLINPEGIDDNWVEYDRQRKISRYYENYYSKEALSDPQRWKKVLTGKADYRSIYNNIVKTVILNKVSTIAFKFRNRFGNSETPKFTAPMEKRLAQVTDAFIRRRIRLLLAFSQGSSSIEYVHTVIGKQLQIMLEAETATEIIVPNADHTFTLLAGQHALSDHIAAWCSSFDRTPLVQPDAAPVP